MATIPAAPNVMITTTSTGDDVDTVTAARTAASPLAKRWASLSTTYRSSKPCMAVASPATTPATVAHRMSGT